VSAAVIVSGRFEGSMTAPKSGSEILELRVDVDSRSPGVVSTNRVSGDFFAVNALNLPGAPPRTWKVYRESWVIEAPTVAGSPGAVDITGTARFWEGTHPPATTAIHIPVGTTIGPAQVALTFLGGTVWRYTCSYAGDAFRDLELEVDVCQSVNRAPLLPSYDTSSHPTAPVGLPVRILTLESAYSEAGVRLAVRDDHTTIDDSDPRFASWSDAELHDAMESHFADAALEWPRWAMWGLLAGTYEDSRVGGIMFDAAADFDGVSRQGERQGFAVFRNHRWFASLPDGAPRNDAEADALRKYLYTWVHEAGHAFNFLHSWDKNRPDALSWMNYDWRYDTRNGTDAFWKAFAFRFDEEELIHLRHGNRAAVIMGGDPWASGGHIEAPPGAEHLHAAPGSIAHAVGEVPLELLLRCKGFFDFMEPVKIEVRLRNLLRTVDLNVDTLLPPEFGGLVLFIRRPDGRIVEYSPITCKLAESAIRTLKAAEGSVAGEDRYSEQLDLTYGRYGFYFDEPGEYLVRAIYQGAGDLLIPSNTLRLRVGHPMSPEVDRLAQDFFVYEVGMNLYLRGSQSPHLQRGFELLRDMAERHSGSVMGAELARTIMRAVAEPFFRVEKGTNARDSRVAVVKQSKSSDPDAALAFTEPALKVFRSHDEKALNLPYSELVRQRAICRATIGDTAGARTELETLRNDLAARGVNPPVLAGIDRYAASFSPSSRRSAPRTAKARTSSRKRSAGKGRRNR
jgi:hypothetical protein